MYWAKMELRSSSLIWMALTSPRKLKWVSGRMQEAIWNMVPTALHINTSYCEDTADNRNSDKINRTFLKITYFPPFLAKITVVLHNVRNTWFYVFLTMCTTSSNMGQVHESLCVLWAGEEVAQLEGTDPNRDPLTFGVVSSYFEVRNEDDGKVYLLQKLDYEVVTRCFLSKYCHPLYRSMYSYTLCVHRAL